MSEFNNNRPSEEALNNPTLGEATTTPFLDQVEAQKREDFNARHEGREARIVVAVGRIPGQFIPSGTVPSSVQPELAYDGEPSINDEELNPEGTNPEEFSLDFNLDEDTNDDSSK